MTREAAIVSTARTPIGKAYRGAFNATTPDVLAAHVFDAALDRAGIDPERVEDVYFGCGNQYGPQFYNIGRMSVFGSKLPESVPAMTLDRKCASGLTTVALAARSIMAGDTDVILAGGGEFVSLTVVPGIVDPSWRSDNVLQP